MTSYMWNIEHVMYYPQNKQTGSIILHNNKIIVCGLSIQICMIFWIYFFGGFFFKLHIENAINHVK